jgi:DNA-directed RNA polymerase subunit RPC12/RpoP
MHEHECVKCGEKFENMLWMDLLCSECERIKELIK